jgi:hypothetical protein
MTSKRSKLEERVGEALEPYGFDYEGVMLPYIICRKYRPDFSLENTHIEVKGWFRPGDTMKYKAIHEALESIGLQLVFIFQNSEKPVRKGAKLTMGGWADKHGIAWYDHDNLEELLKDLELC